MLKSILLIFSSDIVAKMIAMLITFILAKFISVEEFGQYNYIITTLTLFSLIIQPLASAYMRDFRYQNHLKYNLSYNFISFILAFPTGLIMYHFLHQTSCLLIIVFFIYQIVLINLQSYTNIMEEYRKYSFINMMQQISILSVLALYLFLNRKSEIDVESIILYCYTSISILLCIYATKNMHNVVFKANIYQMFLFMKDSIYLISYWTLTPIIGFLDMYFIKHYLNDNELGLYSFAMKIFAISLVGLTPMMTVLRVKQIDIVKSANILEFFRNNIKKVIIMSSVFYMIMIIVTYILSHILFADYKGALSASLILISTSFVSYVTIPFGFLMAGRRYVEVFIIGLIGVSLNVLIKILFIKSSGIIAVAWSSFFAHSFINVSFMSLSFLYLIGKK